MEDFIRSTTGQIIIFLTGISGWVVAIYAAFIQKKSYDMQLDSEKAYEEILNRAKNDWKGKYTTDQVEALKAELLNLKGEIEKNKKEVPIKAKEVFLKDQLFALNSNLEELYTQREKVITEIDKVEQAGHNLNLNTRIRKEIENLLKPIYIKKKSQEKTNRVVLYSILVIAAVLIIPSILSFLQVRVDSDGFHAGGKDGVPVYVILIMLLAFGLGIYLSFRQKITNSSLLKKYSIGFHIVTLLLSIISIGGAGLAALIFIDSTDYADIYYDADVIFTGLFIAILASLGFGYAIQIWNILNEE